MRRALPGLAAACAPLLAACSLIGGGGDDGPFPTISPQSGMTGTSWRNFAFGAPSEWTTQDAGGAPGGAATDTYWSDANNATQMSGSQVGIQDCPTATGQRPNGTTLTAVHRFHVPGAGGALRLTLTGGQHGGETELVVWTPGCDEQLTLHIYAQDKADRIADTIIAKADPD